MNAQEEEYIHFTSSIDNLNTARRILLDVKEAKDSPLIGPAFLYALVEYAKPYKVSFGNIRRHSLDPQHIPKKHQTLHNRIVTGRDKIYAHSDLTLKDAKLYISDFESGRFCTIIQNKLETTTELQNIDEIIDLIELTLDSMLLHLDCLENGLPPSKE